jgi:hemolysin activation/secretion protein
VDRRPNQVLAARSIFSVGLDALGATTNPRDLPDGQFFAWLGQFQWVRRLWDTENQLLVRADLQLAEDPVLPLEKLGVGGATTVRGYRENLLVRDNGFIGSVEFRFPVFRLPLPLISEGPQDGRVQLATFYDFGWSDNTDAPTPDPNTISSLGIGLRWDPHRQIHEELYWGIALREVDEQGEEDLQDSGIHFALDIRLF